QFIAHPIGIFTRIVFHDHCNAHITLFIFFFSSRRRHTRSKRDWSSDVCSSDLGLSPLLLILPPLVAWILGFAVSADIAYDHTARSEERRVGKEWSSAWSAVD